MTLCSLYFSIITTSSVCSFTYLDFCCQAEEVLPPADAVILEVTPEQLESVAFISKQLVMATDSEEALGLFPVDLNTTNNIVVQVRDTGVVC